MLYQSSRSKSQQTNKPAAREKSRQPWYENISLIENRRKKIQILTHTIINNLNIELGKSNIQRRLTNEQALVIFMALNANDSIGADE